MTCVSSAWEISRSLRGPSSSCTRSSARAPKPSADVVTRDDESRPSSALPRNEDVDMWVVGVPVIDRDPVKCCAEIPFGSGHQITGKGTQILEIAPRPPAR